MGTHYAPLLADIFLYSYEAESIYMYKYLLSEENHIHEHRINNPDIENYLDQMYHELKVKDTTEGTTSASYLDLVPSIGRDGTLPFTTNVTISISTSQTFRSWVVIFHSTGMWRFYFTSFAIRAGLLLIILVSLFYSEGQATFQ